MGRALAWLVEARPQIVEILREVQRASPYGATAGGGLGLLLAHLSRITASQGERPRSSEAMRQAWWRWTGDGEGAAVPPLATLSRIVVHAKSRGWLDAIADPRQKALIARLEACASEEREASRKQAERRWAPEVIHAVDALCALYGAENGGAYPDPTLAQEWAKTVIRVFAMRFVDNLRETDNDEVLSTGELGSYFRLHDGWPEALREAGQLAVEKFEESALDLETAEKLDIADHEAAYEAASQALRAQPHAAPQQSRATLFRRSHPGMPDTPVLNDQDLP